MSLIQRLLRFRRVLVVTVHVAMMMVANYLAFSLRFDGALPAAARDVFLAGLPFIVITRSGTFYAFHLFEGMWRYTGMWDLRNLLIATVLSGAASFAVFEATPGLDSYPRSVLVIDGVLLVFLVGAMRVAGRAYREIGSVPRSTRVLIYGAGDAGASIAHSMRNNSRFGTVPVGFIDDDPGKKGRFIHGLKVHGSRHDLTAVASRVHADEILIAMPGVSPSVLRDVVTALDDFDAPIRILPSLPALLANRGLVSIVRPLRIEDLLDRPRVGLDDAVVTQAIAGKRVLVTGAGGSIGSELCRQLLKHNVRELVMIDRYENALYEIEHELRSSSTETAIDAVVADVTDRARVDDLFERVQPEFIFHAAAHKHVPLMEANPCEAVENNIFGTATLMAAAVRCGASKFVLISTDKAVNPTSVMGATKAIAEHLIREQSEGPTSFAAVRFGNVLGSNGSVVPLFMRQIAAGGPVTVTHPEIRRYFMLIPEAVQLVLHAAAIAAAGEMYVLEMGEQVKVVDLARGLIRLSGLRPERDIKLEFVGLRPGEKLYEELLRSDECAERCGPSLLKVSSRREVDQEVYDRNLARLHAAAAASNAGLVLSLLGELEPTYSRPQHDVAMAREGGLHRPLTPQAPAESRVRG